MDICDRPAREWRLALPLDDGDDGPLFARIARAVSDDIRRGRLRRGERLPGSRTLAEQLGVHRNTLRKKIEEYGLK